MIIVAARPGIGKALALDTPLPTPTGWTTMGEVAVGDELIDAGPAAPRVSSLPPRSCAADHASRSTFSDGTAVVADARAPVAHRYPGLPAARPTSPAAVRTTTAEIADDAAHHHGRPARQSLRRDLRAPGPARAGSPGTAVRPGRLAWGRDEPERAHSPAPTRRSQRSSRPRVSWSPTSVRSATGSVCPTRERRRPAPVSSAGRSSSRGRRKSAACGRIVRRQGSVRLGAGARAHLSGLRRAVVRTAPVPAMPHAHAARSRAGSARWGYSATSTSPRTTCGRRRGNGARCSPDSSTRTAPSARRRRAVRGHQRAACRRHGGARRLASVYAARSPRRQSAERRSDESSTAYMVTFSTTETTSSAWSASALAHKDRQRATSDVRTRPRYITDVRPVPSVPVRCVEVANAEHLYLADPLDDSDPQLDAGTGLRAVLLASSTA